MQACGSACLVAQLKRETDLGSTPGIPDISPARRLFERRTKQTRANINKVHKHINKMRQANKHAMMNHAQFTWQ